MKNVFFSLILIGVICSCEKNKEETPETGILNVKVINATVSSRFYFAIYEAGITMAELQDSINSPKPFAQGYVEIGTGQTGITTAKIPNDSIEAQFKGEATYICASILDVPPTDYNYLTGAGIGLNDAYGIDTITVKGNTTLVVDALKMFVPQTKTKISSVDFADPNLKDCIESTGFVYVEDLEICDCSAQGITDISGIENFINLSNLSLSSNDITDLLHLSSLKNIKILTLTHLPNLTDISPLKSLNNLSSVLFQNSDFSNTKFFENLPTSVEYVYARNCGITKIDSVANLNNLINLDLSGNTIANINAVSGLTKLEILHLPGSVVTNLSPLSGLTSLHTLGLSGCEYLSDISALEGLINLTFLDLTYNRINDITPLANLIKLKSLYLSQNNLSGTGISNINPLSNLIELTELSIHSNEISDVTPLAVLTKMVRLELKHNAITSGVKSLKTMKDAMLIDLSDNSGIPSGDVDSLKIYLPDCNIIYP